MEPIPAQGRRRGFNLIEAAIVLGVVGLVIGGIWVAASVVRESMKIDNVTGDLIRFCTDAPTKIPRQFVRSCGGHDYYSRNQILALKLLPPSFIEGENISAPFVPIPETIGLGLPTNVGYVCNGCTTCYPDTEGALFIVFGTNKKQCVNLVGKIARRVAQIPEGNRPIMHMLVNRYTDATYSTYIGMNLILKGGGYGTDNISTSIVESTCASDYQSINVYCKQGY